MGEIFIAFESGVKNPPLRALKLLLPHLSDSREAVQMFLNEAQLTVRMNHPNVVRLFDVGAEDGRYFLVMELVHGMALSTLVGALKSQNARLPATVISYIGRALSDGLHHAHELTLPDGTHLEVIHRDVTPDNILISMTGEVKLSDFGIAKARALDRHTRPGAFKGKYEYAAPEQLRSGPIDRRVDIFGAGLALYQLSTLTSPFHRETDIATLNAIATEDLPPLLALRPDLPDHLLEAIAAATQKDVKQRLPTAAALRDALPPFPKDESQHELASLIRTMCGEPLAKLEAMVGQAQSLIVPSPDAAARRPSGIKQSPKSAKAPVARTPTPLPNATAIDPGSKDREPPPSPATPPPEMPAVPELKTSPIGIAAIKKPRAHRKSAMLALSVGGAVMVGTIAVAVLRPDAEPRVTAAAPPPSPAVPPPAVKSPPAEAAIPAVNPAETPLPATEADAGQWVASPAPATSDVYFIF